MNKNTETSRKNKLNLFKSMAKSLLDSIPKPLDDQIKEALCDDCGQVKTKGCICDIPIDASTFKKVKTTIKKLNK